MRLPPFLWLDAQLSPALAPWIEALCGVPTRSVLRLGLLHATDEALFHAARAAGAAVITKDADSVRLLDAHGPPPVLWVTLGNTSNARMRDVLARALPDALRLLAAGEALVEIADVG